METVPYPFGPISELPSDVETDADPVPGSFMVEDVSTASSQPMAAEEKTMRSSTMLVNGEQDKEEEHSGYFHSDPVPMSAGAMPLDISRHGVQSTSSPAKFSSCPDARAPVQISSPSSSSQQAGGPAWESRNPSQQIAAMKEAGQHAQSFFPSTDDDDRERAKSTSLPYPREEMGCDSGPEVEDDEDVEFYDYFLVFSEKDKAHAKKIMKLLTSHKLKGCLLEKDFPAGASPFKNIADAIERSTYTVLVLTENFTKDRWCEKKLQTSLMDAIEDSEKYNQCNTNHSPS
ncbi:TIR domain-containing adapter molecule 2-like [Branchiostoma floridae]|uniref:TIR domain-containing adapter molecule 2-like n=1 Tax=Branchiostoma floridae TaxID=7739 RepID=A0A9J7MEN9_BRAFL|nr:TIR domain-containing adapter molecule 2-like [Branchiostoma floridae]